MYSKMLHTNYHIWALTRENLSIGILVLQISRLLEGLLVRSLQHLVLYTKLKCGVSSF